MKILNEEISKLLKQHRKCEIEFRRELSKIEDELLKIVKEEGRISKDICTHPDFADHDCDEYNYCGLCGKSWSR